MDALDMDSIVVVRFQDDEEARSLEEQIVRYAQSKKLPFSVSVAAKLELQTGGGPINHPLIVSIGGDGTFLRAASMALAMFPGRHAIFPLNTGHLGFLTNGRKFNGFDHLTQALDEIFNPYSEEIVFEDRMALKARVNGSMFTALNEFFVACGQNEIMTYEIFINGGQVAKQTGSGVLVSTATGSTAHALSAGGPIISPDTNVMQIVPVVSHSLTSRPIVITGRSEVAIEVQSTDRNQVHLHGDGKQLYEVGARIEIVKHPTRVMIVRPPEWNFFNVLSEKMGWK